MTLLLPPSHLSFEDRAACWRVYDQLVLKKEEFLSEGFLRLEEVLSTEEVDHFTSLFAVWYEKNTRKLPQHPLFDPANPSGNGFLFEDPNSYLDTNYLTALHGIIKNYGVGWAACQWYLRTRPVVVYLFALIYGTDLLYSSFDGICFIPDRNLTAANRPSGKPPGENKSWLHKDQDPRIRSICAVQAQFVMTDGEHLRVVPKSHLLDHSHLVDPNATVKHWFKPATEIPGFQLSESLVVKANAGDAILWFSHTTHSGSIRSDTRLVSYVAMRPQSHLTLADRARVPKIIQGRRTTDHWGTGMNGLVPQTYGDLAKDATLLDTYIDEDDIPLGIGTQRRISILLLQTEEEGLLLNGSVTTGKALLEIRSLQDCRKELLARRKEQIGRFLKKYKE